MSLWDWFNERREEFRRAGDRERLRLAGLHHEGFVLQETDPDAAYEIFTEASHLAHRLGESWFVFFYDVWRVQALTSYKKDFRNVLDLAVHCVLEARKPVFELHPWRLASFNHLVDAYLGIDPLGHADGIREALDYLGREIDPGPNSHRYVMLGHQRDFALERGALDEARERALEELALTDADDGEHRADWFALPATLDLAWIGWRQGDWEAVADAADRAEELAPVVDQSQGELAEALLWKAVLARRGGDESRARRCGRAAVARMARLRSPPDQHYQDALALFHELGGNLDRAIAVRDRELIGIANRGRLAYECKVRIKRCRLLALRGSLRKEDVSAARAAAARLRRPESYLAEIETIVTG